MKKIIPFLAIVVMLFCSPTARAENTCDTMSKDIDVYYCMAKSTEANYKTCIDFKKLEPSDGCSYGPVDSGKGGIGTEQIVYVLAKANQEKQLKALQWKCDNPSNNIAGGLKSEYMVNNLRWEDTPAEVTYFPDYAAPKFPGKLRTEIRAQWEKDMLTKGKRLLSLVSMESPTDIKFTKQVCQYYNPTTNTALMKITADMKMKGNVGGSLPLGGSNTENEAKPADKLKKLFGN